MYDYLIVGSGLFGSTCAYELNKKGYKCLVIEKRNHIGGNIYTENKLWYVDYSDGFFYIQHGTIDANTVNYPTCIPTDPTKSDIFLRCFKGVWRPNIFERTNLGGILARQEEECDNAEPLALVVIVIIGLLLF